jgi:hypothetical protein
MSAFTTTTDILTFAAENDPNRERAARGGSYTGFIAALKLMSEAKARTLANAAIPVLRGSPRKSTDRAVVNLEKFLASPVDGKVAPAKGKKAPAKRQASKPRGRASRAKSKAPANGAAMDPAAIAAIVSQVIAAMQKGA